MFYGLLFTQYVNSRCIDVGDDYILANTTFNQYLLPAMIGFEEALKSTGASVHCDASLSHADNIFPSFRSVIVQDGALGCTNILDALVDVAYSALEKAGAKEVEIIKVTETRGPSGEGHPARERKSRLLLMHKLIITT
uniref:Uncharacterized protein n=1 Tax=Populus alba TaxID=43335 RepID=A0A4V6A899_POPAL|nr:hypothetical protein D5086_0000163850 [Populus alba]